MYYSKSTNGFYDRAIHGDNIPADAVEITAEEHAALINGQASGKIITADETGRPVLADPPPLSQEELNTQKVQEAKQDYELGIKNLIGEVPYTEIASWDKQENEARALLADSTAVTPFIDALVVARNMGETREVLAGKIVANADAYAIGAAQLLGEYQAKLKEINGV